MKNNYIQSIYESIDSQFKQEYFALVSFYKEHPFKKYSNEECYKNPELYSEIQHINPCWYFKRNNLSIDNSENNKVRVPYKIHLKMHILLVKHFKEINDVENYKSAVFAAQMLTWKGTKTKRNFKLLSDKDLDELVKIRVEAQKARSEFTKQQHKNGKIKVWRKFTPEFIDKVEKAYNENEDGFAAVSKFTNHFKNENHIRLFLWQHKRFRKHKDFALKGKPIKYTEEFIKNLHKLYIEHDDGKTSPWYFIKNQKIFPISHLTNDGLMRLFDKYGLKYQKYDIKYGKCKKVDIIKSHKNKV